MNERMTLLGRKLGQTQRFAEDGELVGVTVIEVGPCAVLRKKTQEKDGYSAIQLGFGEIREKLVPKPVKGQYKEAKTAPKRTVREVRLPADEVAAIEVGQTFGADWFRPGELVDVVGVTKGKGFQGVIKRHHMHGFPKTRGTHEYRRHGGSIGCRSYPGKIHKGKRMAGHMGDVRRTVSSVEVVEVLPEKNVILIAGSAPGARGGFVMVRDAKKRTLAKFDRSLELADTVKTELKEAIKKAAKEAPGSEKTPDFVAWHNARVRKANAAIECAKKLQRYLPLRAKAKIPDALESLSL